jgi:2-methylisocitrate lyase-like PEP mutase family enzyme
VEEREVVSEARFHSDFIESSLSMQFQWSMAPAVFHQKITPFPYSTMALPIYRTTWILVLLLGCATTSCSALSINKSTSNSNHQHPSERLLDLISQARKTQQALPLLGVHDALSARIFQQQYSTNNNNNNMGLFVSGFGVSAARLGQPDAGILTRCEMEATAMTIIQQSAAVPVMVDGDTGFGGTSNVRQTIRQMAAIRAAAITIEDQVFPKRCTYVAGTGVNVVSREQARQRMRAALAAQTEAWEQDGNRILVVARTDCRMSMASSLGFDEAMERCLIFEELGADVVYAENLQSADEYEKLRATISSPMMLAQVQTGRQDQNKLLTLQEIGSMGFEMALWGVTGLQASVAALEQAASELLAGGMVSSTPLASLDQVKQIVGFPELDSFEKEYGCT